MSRSYTSSPPCASMACSGTPLPLILVHDMILLSRHLLGVRRTSVAVHLSVTLQLEVTQTLKLLSRKQQLSTICRAAYCRGNKEVELLKARGFAIGCSVCEYQ
jgi:hypothetical protein